MTLLCLQKREIVQTLERHGRVLISSDGILPKDLESFRINLPAYRLHDLLYYAQLVVSEGATMATEAAVLGTPAVYSSPMAPKLGNFLELMNRYQLVYSSQDYGESLRHATNILKQFHEFPLGEAFRLFAKSSSSRM